MNIPIELNGKKIFIIGMGGGFDILGAMPFINEYDVVGLANLNTDCRGFSSKQSEELSYSPEYEVQKITGKTVHVIAKEGVRSVRKGYEKALTGFDVDVLILVDGGVDSIMRGDEKNPGTLLEDSVSLAAAAKLPIKEKYLVCLGFGTELEEQVCHYRALENIAALARSGFFLGSCSMISRMASFQYYRSVADKLFSTTNRKSHIHTRIIPAVEGKFGKLGIISDAAIPGVKSEDAWINPLMGMLWFFDLGGVASQNLWCKNLEITNTWTDVMMIYRQGLGLQMRESVNIPL